MVKQAELLARLAKLHARRDAKAASLAALDGQIASVTRQLAKERGVLFIRPEAVRQEAARHA